MRVLQVALVLPNLRRRMQMVLDPTPCASVTLSGTRDVPTAVHCFSSTMTAESPWFAFDPVIRQASRFDVSGNRSSTRMPWYLRSASCSTSAIARSEFCHARTSDSPGL